MRAITEPGYYPKIAPPAITVHALKSNPRPIGFAPWPDPAPKPKRVRKPKPKAPA